jgi:hypothetical protein
MSVSEIKKDRKKPLNGRLLTISAILLVGLALLFLASPMIGGNRIAQSNGGFPRTFNGQSPQPGMIGTPQPGFESGGSGTVQTFPGMNGGSAGSARTRPGVVGLAGFGFMAGRNNILIYGIALVLALIAAIGMLNTKLWGKVMGIIIAVVYLLLSIFSFLPIILFSFMGTSNPISLILGIVQVTLALAVIILAAIPGKSQDKLSPVPSVEPTL